MTTQLDIALAAHSPRIAPPPTPWRAAAIHGAVMLLWVVLLARALFLTGVFAWSAGIAYVGYDTILLIFVFAFTLDLARARPRSAGDDAPPASIGVIIAAYNEAAVLPFTLQALWSQSTPPQFIVIADDGSTDDTAALLTSRFGLVRPPEGDISAPSPSHSGLHWLRVAHGGKARALNAALLVTPTDLVLTVDADTRLEPDAVAAMAEAFATEPSLVAATGVLTPVCGPDLEGRVLQWFQTYEYVRNFLSRHAWARLDSLLLISGAFAGFRRTAVMEVGGFDSECLVEDYELIHRLRRHGAQNGLGWTTAVLGTALGRTSAPGTVGAFLRQRRRWFGGFLQTQYWYRDMCGNRRFGWLGLAMLPVKAIDTMQPIYGLTALALLFYYLVTGHLAVAFPVAGIIGAKIVLDFANHLWSVHLYRRWVGGRTRVSLGPAFIASLLEPFTFQALRHLGASWGWVAFLAGSRRWGGQQTRQGLDQAVERV